jgi:hypothetical protein
MGEMRAWGLDMRILLGFFVRDYSWSGYLGLLQD